MGSWVISFAGLALLYGGLASFAILALLRIAGRFPGWHVLPFLMATLTFVFLTQHPFPDPATLPCPMRSAEPQLKPFFFLETIWRLERRDATPIEFFTNRALAATAMNLVLCMVIGATLTRHTQSLAKAAIFGCVLTLTVELTQLTGIWGLYPCAYRQFNVDDLIMNAAGVLIGAALARLLKIRKRDS